MHVARPQHGVDEALTQSQAFLKAVVIAAHRVAGDQGVKHLFLIVAVVLRARLSAVGLNRKAVDVDRDPPRGMVVARGPQVTPRPVGQRLAELLDVGFEVSQGVEQARLRGLAGQPLLLHALARAVPGGQPQGRIVGQLVHVVLGVVALGQRVEAFAEQFHQLIAGTVRIAAIVESGGQRAGQVEAMIRLAQQQHSGVTGQAILPAPHLHGAIESGLEQRLFAFTHEVSPFRLPCCRTNPGSCRALRTPEAEGSQSTVNNARAWLWKIRSVCSTPSHAFRKLDSNAQLWANGTRTSATGAPAASNHSTNRSATFSESGAWSIRSVIGILCLWVAAGRLPLRVLWPDGGVERQHTFERLDVRIQEARWRSE